MDNLNSFLIIAFYLSKFSEDAAEDLGFHNQTDAMNQLSAIFKKDIKRRRDEFDVLTNSNRVGFVNKKIRTIIQEHFDILNSYSYDELTEKVQGILRNEKEKKSNIYDYENESEDETIYTLKDVRFERSNYSIYELNRKYKKGNLILKVEFQRADIWKKSQKSELIESIVMGLPLPVLYFSRDEKNIIKVVDGKQRLSTLFQFLNDEFSINKLTILKNLNGKKFSQLSEVTQTIIEDYILQVNEILPPTPDKVMFDIFERVNRCGTPLNKQEIRNAIYPGHGLEMIKRIAVSKEFENATGKSLKNNNRMKAEYIITRFFAFSFWFSRKYEDNILNFSYNYNGDTDELIKYTYKKLNESDKLSIESYEKNAKMALENAYFYLGENAFRKPSKCENNTPIFNNTPINMNIFETIMILMSHLPYKSDKLKHTICNKTKNVIYSDEFLDSIGNRRDSNFKVDYRFKIILKLKDEISNAETYMDQ